MARFKLTIEYAGTRYSGWQIQKNARTVQGELARAVHVVTRRDDFELYGSGRTDAGVHATGQVAHLDLETRLGVHELLRALNDELPADVHVLAGEKVTRRFHARHDALARSYLYQLARRRSAFAKPFVWWVKEPLDLARMRAAATVFAGLQDFRAFTAADPEETSTKVLVEGIELAEEGDLVLVRVVGSHFLWKMVRRLVGVLVEAGRGALQPRDVARLLRDDGQTAARLTAPPSGLFLERVFYAGDARGLPLRSAVPVGR